MNKQLNPARNIGESYEEYRARRKKANAAVKAYLLGGTPAEAYKNGPHKTHLPHVVEQKGTVISAAGVPTPHVWSVLHPGTLMKA